MYVLYSTLTPQQMAPQQISTKLIELFTLTIHQALTP